MLSNSFYFNDMNGEPMIHIQFSQSSASGHGGPGYPAQCGCMNLTATLLSVLSIAAAACSAQTLTIGLYDYSSSPPKKPRASRKSPVRRWPTRVSTRSGSSAAARSPRRLAKCAPGNYVTTRS